MTAQYCDVTHRTIEQIGRIFAEQAIGGDELEVMRPKSLRRILNGHLNGTQMSAAVAAVLGQRDLLQSTSSIQLRCC